MNDNEKSIHDLAIVAVSELVRRNYDAMAAGNDTREQRDSLARSIYDEYIYLCTRFEGLMK